MAKLGEVCRISPSTKSISRQNAWLLNLDMIEQQTGRVNRHNYVSEEELRGSIVQFDTENVLYSKLRPNLNKVVLPDTDGFSTSELLPLRPDSSVLDRDYLATFLRSDNFVIWAVSKTAGAKMPRLGTKELMNVEIPIPTIEQQKAIAAKFKKLEQLIFLHKQQLTKLDELVKARFVEMFGDPVYNEMHWETKRLIDICRIIVDCPHSTPHYTTKDTGYKCIRTSAVKKNKILWEKVECISKQEYEERIKRKRPEKGDVIYTREGAILGISAVIDRDYNVALGQRSMLLSPDIYKCTPCFLSMAMNFDSFLGKALGGVSGSASPHINVGDIKALEIIAPPIEIQNQFSTFVEQVDQQKQTVQQSLEKLELLKKALMQEYFG